MTLFDWLDDRTGFRRWVRRALDEPVPGGARWAYVFGSVLLALFALQVVTGLLLAITYTPSAAGAWKSVRYLTEEVPFGRFIRSVHSWGSGAMVVTLLLHMAQVLVFGADRKPREVNWMTGVGLLLFILGFGFTGYLLPWDQNGYWATQVGATIMGTVPVVGSVLRTLVQGGESLGNLTLSRFYALHVILLPASVGLLVAAHLYLFRRHGLTSRPGARPDEPFWPGQAARDLTIAGAAILAVAALAVLKPVGIGDPADPSIPFEARPEWYFLFAFQLLKYFTGPLEVVGTVILPALGILLLFAVPFLDRAAVNAPGPRRAVLGAGAAGLFVLAGLTGQAVISDWRTRIVPPETAAALYAAKCAECHLPTGVGKYPGMPNFTDVKGPAGKDPDRELRHSILNGKPGLPGQSPAMPAWKGQLREADIRGLIRHIRGLVRLSGPLPQGATGS